MKKTLIILVLFLFPILISFNSYGGSSDRTACADMDFYKRWGSIYFSQYETEPFTGKNLCEYENGQVKSKGKVTDGKLDGMWTHWYENGQIESEKHFKDGDCISGC